LADWDGMVEQCRRAIESHAVETVRRRPTLSEAKRQRIRFLLAKGLSVSLVAARVQVSKKTVERIKRGRR